MQRTQSYYYFKPPHMSDMPQHPFPDVASELDWYGEIRLRYYLDQEVYSMGFGHSMKALSELRAIMNDICVVSFGQSAGPRKITWEHALHFRARLQAWYDALPDSLSSSKLLFPAHLKLQYVQGERWTQFVSTNIARSCEYHSTLIMLFSSQLSTTSRPTTPLTSNQEDMAHNIVTLSMIQLESLLRIYYLRHSFESYDSLLVVFLAHLSQETLARLTRLDRPSTDSSNDDVEALRSTLVLCLKGLHDQGKNFHVSGLVFHILKDRLSAEDQSLVDQYVMPKDGEADCVVGDRSQRVVSDYVVPTVHLHEDPWAARLSNIVQRSENMSLEG